MFVVELGRPSVSARHGSHSKMLFVGSGNWSVPVCVCVQLMSACVLGVAAWIRDSLNTVLTLTAHTRWVPPRHRDAFTRYTVKHQVTWSVCVQVGGSSRPHVLSGRPSRHHRRVLLPGHHSDGGLLRRAQVWPAAALLGESANTASGKHRHKVMDTPAVTRGGQSLCRHLSGWDLVSGVSDYSGAPIIVSPKDETVGHKGPGLSAAPTGLHHQLLRTLTKEKRISSSETVRTFDSVFQTFQMHLCSSWCFQT